METKLTDKNIALLLLLIAIIAMSTLSYWTHILDVAAIESIESAQNRGTSFTGTSRFFTLVIYLYSSAIAFLILMAASIASLYLRISKFPHLSKFSVILRSAVIPFEIFTISFTIYIAIAIACCI